MKALEEKFGLDKDSVISAFDRNKQWNYKDAILSASYVLPNVS